MEPEHPMKHFRSLFLVFVFACGSAAAESFLWEVSSLTNKVYLFGTVHAGKPTWYPLPRVVEDAFADSRVLVVEADITDNEAMKRSAAAMVYKPPATLQTHMPAEQYARFRRYLAKYGLVEEQVAQMKPFMAVSLLVFNEWARAGFLPDYGVDAYLIGKAKSAQKRVVEIEGVDNQIRLMDSLSNDDNVALFKGTLDALDSGLTVEQINGMVDAWRGGNPTLMLETARRYNDKVLGAADFEEKFVWSRHTEMAKKIEGYLNDSKERHFVAVGALHLAGPRGLVEILKKRGYIVKQL
jgi:uncharacterized protein YbaP (TraB family)